MSRIAKKPIALPKGVEVNIQASEISVKGPKGTLSVARPEGVEIKLEDGTIEMAPVQPSDMAITGTTRSIVDNMVRGVSEGFERKLELVGVGYRAAVQGKDLNLTLGFSHPVLFPIPEGITITTPTQTEVLVAGADKQQVGQVAAKIRGLRPPEPYKGKGVKYAGEVIRRKAGKAGKK